MKRLNSQSLARIGIDNEECGIQRVASYGSTGPGFEEVSSKRREVGKLSRITEHGSAGIWEEGALVVGDGASPSNEWTVGGVF